MLQDHPQREMLSRELHARPFPKVNAPASVAYWAIVSEGTPDEDRAILCKLLKLMGYGDLKPEGSHFYSRLGEYELKWERHTEFVSYTLFIKRETSELFQSNPHDHFPKEWMDKFDGQILTSCFLDILGPFGQKEAEGYVTKEFFKHFSAESLAVNYVLNREAVVASDFTMDESGHIKLVVMAIGQVGENRLGRIVQRLFEIETYKSLAMLTLPVARDIFAQVGVLNKSLTGAVHAIAEGEGTSQDRLDALLSVAAKIEYLQSQSSYRFSAVEAYNAIVTQRIQVLREERLQGRQTFTEFMMRRFDPAMRTCESAQARLRDISARAARASDLLATRVTVRTNEQNRALLHQMDERASLQLRLQETVEGLSVVAISYYAVNLATYLLIPVAKIFHFEKWQLTAALIIPTVLIVWGMIRRIKRHVTKDE
ncbi:DUF3422 domain-containing protein [Amylibacter sp. SFDW26]|uniref:DUF3422 family protein n=1 Tax=Amylibacter sp. SFDW26 TaxID=2652722 RepID=UPI0012624663|nr:DUF3422 domain-containing protein [Amylibacter sp. SFDW26]KAB7614300.1 DUF3422 domain-containing protein [Amylibacter sp. SFDW26]